MAVAELLRRLRERTETAGIGSDLGLREDDADLHVRMIHHSAGAAPPLSPRARRRLLWLAALAAAGGAIALVFVLLPETKGGFDTPRSGGAVQVVRPQRQVPLSTLDRRKIDALLDRFVPAAVDRRDPAAAYDLTTATLHSVAPRRQWRSGNIPIAPFDAGGHDDGRAKGAAAAAGWARSGSSSRSGCSRSS